MPQNVEVVGEGTYTFPDDATDDEIQEALSQPVAPPAGAPSPAEFFPPGGVPPLAGGAALRPGSLVPEVPVSGNPLREAMLGRRMAAGGATLASLGPADVQTAGAAAMAPLPPTQGPGTFEGAPQALAAGAVDVAQSAASLPRVTARLGEGLAEAVLGEAAGALVRKLGAIAPQRLAGDLLEEKAIKPAAEFYQGGETARRDAREAPLGEKLEDPGWALRQGLRQVPQLATSLVSAGSKGASVVGKMAAPFVMEAGEAARGLEEEEARSGEKIDNLRFGAAVAGKGAVNAALELAGAEAILGRLTKFLPASVKKTIGRNVAEFMTGAAGEGLTERGQQVVGNFTQMMAAEPPKNWTDLAARARTPEFWQALDKGGAEAQFLGSFIGTGATAISSGSKAADVRSRAGRMAERRAWRAEEGPGEVPAPVLSLESGPGRGTVPQADIDGINEAVRALQNPETADPPLRPQPPSRPISVDQLLGAQAPPGVVKETSFRDQTAEARGRNVQAAAAGEERQKIANTPGAALRLILGDDPTFAPRPPAETFPQEVSEVSQGSEVSLRPRVSMPILDWIDQRSQEVDEDRRTAPPEEWDHDEARYFALTDPGTGLANRQAYNIATAQSPEAVHAVLDVDNLKKVNDTFGHEVGDEYLGMVGLAARQNGVRLFRVGGDEFTAVYDGDETDLQKMLETTRKGLQASRVSGSTETGGEYPLHEGFSYGTGRDFKTADARAYEDKRRRKAGGSPGANPEAHPQPVGVGRSNGQEAAAGPRDPARVPPPLRGPGNDDSGSSGAPPAGPASLPPPVTPAAPAAAAALPPRTLRFLLEPTGSVTEAVTDDGEKVSARWEIVDGGDIIGSHDEETQAPNPEFDQALQPRDRVRNASEMWVEEKSKSIRPQELADSYLASSGAPIVSKDRQILSGNGRNQLLDRAYRLGRAEEYRRYLEENASRWGKTAEDVRGKATPKLIRVLTEEPANRAELARKMNVSSVATMSASETAAADADRLTPEMLSRFEPGEGGNAILSVRNRGFVEKFFASVPANERGRLIDSEGQLSQDGVRRIQNALMAKAYGTSPVLERLAESTDDNIKTVSTALSNAAPGMAAVKAGIAKGDILPLDPVPGILEAAAKLSHLRDTKTSVPDFLDQSGLFGDEMSPEGREFLRAFEDFKRSGKKLSEFLTSLSEGLITEGGAKQETLFGDAPAPRLEDFIRAARRAVLDRGQVPLFGGEGDLRADGPETDRPGPLPPGGRSGPVDRPRVSLAQGSESTPPTPRHVMLIERFARSLSESWKDAPKVVVVATEADLPEAIRERAQSFDATGGVEGVYMGAKDDRVFLVASRLKSREDVERVVLHEVMGHAGLRRVLDRGTFNSVMDQIATSLPKDVEAKAREYGLDLKDAGERREAADEVLAEWASRTDAPPGPIARAMVAIRGWLRKHFPSLKWTEADVRELLAQARTRIEQGAEGKRGESTGRFSRTVTGDQRFSRAQESTPAFKKWFGASKVVDDNGQPKVVYHGTWKPGFGEMESPAYFSASAEYASGYAGADVGENGALYPAYVSLQTPLDLRDLGERELSARAFAKELEERGVRLSVETKEVLIGVSRGPVWEFMRRLTEVGAGTIARSGFDGVMQRESGTDVFVAFKPAQIKSATGNRGTFDPSKKDIRFSRSSSSAEDRIYDAMVARARSRATAAAEAAQKVRAELEDPGDVMEARRDRDLPDHSREVQNHIRPAGNRETITGLLNPLEARYQEVVRRHYAIEKASARMGTGTGPAHRDPGVVAELAAGHSARAEQMLAGSGGFRNGADGNIEWTGNRALQTILGDLGPGRLNELRRYLVARRAIELHHRTSPQQELGATQEKTIYSGITEAAAQQEVAGAPADIKKAAEEVTALLDDALRYWADAGGLSPAAVDVIRDMNRAYVPFYRIFEGKDPGKQGRLVLPAKRGVALQSEQAVKSIFGSQRDILDPLVAVADHIQRMIRAADLNRVGKTLVEAAALNPEAAYGLVEEVSTGRNPSEGVTNEGKAVQDAAGAFGVEVGDEAASALSFLSDKKLSYADDRIKVWQAGKLKEYRVAREIGESLRALGPEEMKLFGKAVIFPSKLLRGGVTKNPIFQLHNFLRDTADAGVQSQNGFIPILDSIRGFKEALRDGALRREWLASGGGFATLSGGGLKGAEKVIRDIAPRTRAQSVLRTVIHPLEALSVFGRPFEEAARLGEYRKARLAGKSATEGALDAARVTTNFTVHGADAHFWWLAKASAFTNPAIQGADKAFRTVLEAPRGEKQSAGRIARASAAMAVRGLLNVSLASAVLYALNYDDDEIEELRKTKAGAVWWFMRVPGTKVILRMPKPFLWGQVFGTGMETALDKARGVNPDAMKRWRTEVLEMLADNVFPIPTAAKVYNALTYNFDPFFKRPIVPRGLENAEPEMQVTTRTGETARQVGKLARGLPNVTGVGWLKSPAKLEHAVGALGGTLGREALKASDTVLRDPGTSPPAKRLSELPLVGRAFATGGTTGTYSIERFWREADKVRMAKTTLREKMKSDPAGAREYSREHRRELMAGRIYEDGAEHLGEIRNAIEAIRKAPDSRFTPAEKTRRIDALEARMNDVAKKIVSRDLLQENER